MFSTTQYERALRAIAKPRGRQLLFLQAHVDAPGHALTMTRLAEAAGYRSYHGVNLQYGLLADRIGRAIDSTRPNPRLTILAAFAKPKTISNREYVLVMQPKFVAALRKVGWVS